LGKYSNAEGKLFGEKKRGQATFSGVWQGQADRPSQGVPRVNWRVPSEDVLYYFTIRRPGSQEKWRGLLGLLGLLGF